MSASIPPTHHIFMNNHSPPTNLRQVSRQFHQPFPVLELSCSLKHHTFFSERAPQLGSFGEFVRRGPAWLSRSRRPGIEASHHLTRLLCLSLFSARRPGERYVCISNATCMLARLAPTSLYHHPPQSFIAPDESTSKQADGLTIYQGHTLWKISDFPSESLPEREDGDKRTYSRRP